MRNQKIILAIGLCALLASCKKKDQDAEDEKNLEPCFTASDVTPGLNDTVTFDATCSKNAESVEWHITDGTGKRFLGMGWTLKYHFTSQGTYIITARAKKGNASKETNKEIAVDMEAKLEILPGLNSTIPMEILVKANCAQSFIIRNTGHPSTTLTYSAICDVEHGTNVHFSNNNVGELRGNEMAEIFVTFDDVFFDFPPRDAMIRITSNASVEKVLMVRYLDELAYLQTTWLGVWTGWSYGPVNAGYQRPKLPVEGTWSFHLQSLDLVALKFTGSLTWSGSDYHWTYDTLAGGTKTNIAAVAYPITTVIPVTSERTEVMINGCGTYLLHGNAYPPLGSPPGLYYGPYFGLELSALKHKRNESKGSFYSFYAWQIDSVGPSPSWGSKGMLTVERAQ